MWQYNHSDTLYHHGIKGQRWGVRRYQNKDGSLTSAGKKRYNSDTRNTDVNKPNNTSNSRSLGKSKVDKILSSNKTAGMSGDTSTLAFELGLYTVTTLGLLAAAKIKEKMQKKEFDDELEYKYSRRDIESLEKAPRLKEPMSASESMKLINPGYPKEGRVENCVLCTTAMVMREKGYDVKANTSDHGYYKENADKFFKEGGEFKKIKAKKSVDIVNQLNTEGDGAYGNLIIRWNLGGGHSVFWKNEGGKTHIYDGQSGEEYELDNPKYSKFLKNISSKGASYARLDNVEPNELALAALTKE
jgi:hypothetical protein